MNNLPTQITIRTCQEDGGTVAGCIHYSYAGETIDTVELAFRRQEQIAMRTPRSIELDWTRQAIEL